MQNETTPARSPFLNFITLIFSYISAYSRHTRIGATIYNIRVISINMAITRGATTTTPNALLLKISIHGVDTALTRLVTLIDFTQNNLHAAESDNSFWQLYRINSSNFHDRSAINANCIIMPAQRGSTVVPLQHSFRWISRQRVCTESVRELVKCFVAINPAA